MQRIQDNERVNWIAISDANKKCIQTKRKVRTDQVNASQANIPNDKGSSDTPPILGFIVELACKARSAIRELDPIVNI